MTFTEIWNQLCQKKEGLNKPDATSTFTSEGLRRLLRQVYDQGHEAGKNSANGEGVDFLSDLLGGRRKPE